IMSRVSEYENMVNKLLCRNEKLRGALMVYEKIGVAGASRGGVCYGQDRVNVSRMPIAKMDVKKNSYAVVVKGVDERMTSEQVKESVMKHVKPNIGVRVKAVRKTRNGVVIETVSEGERKELYESKNYGNTGLKIQLPRKIGPKMIVIVNRGGKKGANVGNVVVEANVNACKRIVSEGRMYVE
ncbi:hypothetical protein ALC62_15753, partial [Cyphomyrmex costatus]